MALLVLRAGGARLGTASLNRHLRRLQHVKSSTSLDHDRKEVRLLQVILNFTCPAGWMRTLNRG